MRCDWLTDCVRNFSKAMRSSTGWILDLRWISIALNYLVVQAVLLMWPIISVYIVRLHPVPTSNQAGEGVGTASRQILTISTSVTIPLFWLPKKLVDWQYYTNNNEVIKHACLPILHCRTKRASKFCPKSPRKACIHVQCYRTEGKYPTLDRKKLTGPHHNCWFHIVGNYVQGFTCKVLQ